MEGTRRRERRGIHADFLTLQPCRHGRLVWIRDFGFRDFGSVWEVNK
jgi:hypothetical protein